MNTKQKALPRLHQPFGSREFYIKYRGSPQVASMLLHRHGLDGCYGLTPEEVDRFGRLFGSSQDLLDTAERLLRALQSHVVADSNRARIPVNEVCPCYGNEIKEARAIIARAKGED